MNNDNNSKIIYRKGYIGENNKKCIKGGSTKITKSKNNSKKSNLVLLNPYNRPIDIENKFIRRKELADEEIEKELSKLTLNSDIHDWYKNKEDISSIYDDSITDIRYKPAVESI